MKVFGLVSGGKDSIFNLIQCINKGHNLVAIGHLSPEKKNSEVDSYMYQSVGSELIEAIGQCLGVPLITRVFSSKAINTQLDYVETKDDEVEDLFLLLKEAKEKFQIEAVSSGAIFSTYQKNRVENVCQRLGLKSLAYLWEREQKELLCDMIANNMNSVLIKVCVIGLDKIDLMKSLSEMKNKLYDLNEKYKINVCGEGGEYETITLDSPIYKKKIIIDEFDVVCHSKDIYSPVYYAFIKKFHIEDKKM